MTRWKSTRSRFIVGSALLAAWPKEGPIGLKNFMAERRPRHPVAVEFLAGGHPALALDPLLGLARVLDIGELPEVRVLADGDGRTAVGAPVRPPLARRRDLRGAPGPQARPVRLRRGGRCFLHHSCSQARSIHSCASPPLHCLRSAVGNFGGSGFGRGASWPSSGWTRRFQRDKRMRCAASMSAFLIRIEQSPHLPLPHSM